MPSPAAPSPSASPHPRRRPAALLGLTLAAGVTAGVGLQLAGCSRADAGIRWPVPAPPAVNPSKPELWVALAAHLGQGPLQLQAASGALELVDGRGQRQSGRTLTLRWRAAALARPLLLERQVLGPFPSFETAEQVALAWKRPGREVVIAHPREWEVWAEPGLEPPGGQRPRLERLRIRERLTPELRTAGGWRPLTGPVRLAAAGGLRWQGGTYAGPFRLQEDSYGGWTLVEQVPLERYLEGVVPHEIGAGAPAAALTVQAVLARTWALRNQQRFAIDGYHLCADTQCQVYSDPRQAGAAVRQAIQTSRGRVLSWRQRPIQAVYHASNGGVMASYTEAWSAPALAYLRPATDGPASLAATLPLPLSSDTSLRRLLQQGGQAYGASHPLFRWSRRLSRDQIEQALAAAGSRIGSLQQIQVLERGPSGRVVRLGLRGSAGSLVLQRDAIRRTLRKLPSTLFIVSAERNGVWRFEGGGFGHGAGLSQAGAIDLAGRGWTAERILNRYYPGTSLVGLDSLAPAEPAGGGL